MADELHKELLARATSITGPPSKEEIIKRALALGHYLVPGPMTGTTIGPKAISLGDEMGYLRKVIGESIWDLSKAGKNLDKVRSANPIASDSALGIKDAAGIVRRSYEVPKIRGKVMAADVENQGGSFIQSLTDRFSKMDDSWTKDMLNELVDIYHPYGTQWRP